MITEFALKIAQRRTPLAEGFFHGFGENRSVAAVESTVWNESVIYPWEEFATPQTLYIQSTDAADTGTLVLYGLDENFLPLREEVTMLGLSTVTTSNTFSRVNSIKYEQTVAVNAGTITARTVSNLGTIVASIAIDAGDSAMAIYTVPADRKGYLVGYTTGTSKAKETITHLHIREPNNGGFSLINEMEINNNTVTLPFFVPYTLKPKTDVDFRALASGGGGSVILSFDILLDE